MNRELLFSLGISDGERQWRAGLEPPAFLEVFDLAQRLGVWRGNKHIPREKQRSITVRGQTGDPAVAEVMEKLRKLGLEPYRGYVPERLKWTHYALRTVVTYDEADIADAELLLLQGWGEWPLASLHGRRDGRWVAEAEGFGQHTALGWRETHGMVDGHHNHFVNSDVRAFFEKAGVDVQYHPLLWSRPELAKAEYWEMDTRHRMPPCLVPAVSDEEGMRFYDDGGCEPAELKFHRDKVKAMGPFDAAWNCEELGVPGDPRDGGHVLVVSQRFRKACEGCGLRHVSFVPVRLVE